MGPDSLAKTVALFLGFLYLAVAINASDSGDIKAEEFGIPFPGSLELENDLRAESSTVPSILVIGRVEDISGLDERNVDVFCDDDDAGLNKYSVSLANKKLIDTLACAQFDDNPSSCRRGKCNFNLVTRKCVSGKQECSLCTIDYNECKRYNTYYVNAGVLCKNMVHRGHCYAYQVIKAVNLEEDKQTKGIFENDDDNDDDIPVYMNVNTDRKYELTFSDSLYQIELATEATTSKTNSGNCLKYTIPINSIGQYELSVKLGDFSNSDTGNRTINIQFNGVRIVEELDVLSFTEKLNHVMDLNVNFKVRSSFGQRKIDLPGHPTMDLLNDEISLEFCHESDSLVDEHWHLSAWSVNKFDDEDLLEENDEMHDGGNSCSKDSNYPLFCHKNECSYDVITGECTDENDKLDHVSDKHLKSGKSRKHRTKRSAKGGCSNFSDDPIECTSRNCDYNKTTKVCEKKKAKLPYPKKGTKQQCNNLNGMPRECGYIGCMFDKHTGNCNPVEDAPIVVEKPCIDHGNNEAACKSKPNCKFYPHKKKCVDKKEPDEKRCVDHADNKATCETDSECKFLPKKKKCVDKTEPDEPAEVEDRCAKFSDNPRSCWKSGCQFKLKTQKCETAEVTEVSETCSANDADVISCSMTAGCTFVSETLRCMENEEGSDDTLMEEEITESSIQGRGVGDEAGVESEQPAQARGRGFGFAIEFSFGFGGGGKKTTQNRVAPAPPSPPPAAETDGDAGGKGKGKLNCPKYDDNPKKCDKKDGCWYDKSIKRCLFGESSKEAEVDGEGDQFSEYVNCRERDGNQEECNKIDCIYDSNVNKCFENDADSDWVKDGKLNSADCGELDGFQKACRYPGCRFRPKTKRCLCDRREGKLKQGKKLTNDECGAFSNKQKACGLAGCYYMIQTQKCYQEDGAKSSEVGSEGTAAPPPATIPDAKVYDFNYCKQFNGDEAKCTSSGCRWKASNNKCKPVKIVTKQDRAIAFKAKKKLCRNFDGDYNGCIDLGCMYHKASNQCLTYTTEYDESVTMYIIILIKIGQLSELECAELDGYEKGCNFAGCYYENEAKKCVPDLYHDRKISRSNLTHAECSGMNGLPRPCGYAGCAYNVRMKTCEAYGEGNDAVEHYLEENGPSSGGGGKGVGPNAGGKGGAAGQPGTGVGGVKPGGGDVTGKPGGNGAVALRNKKLLFVYMDFIMDDEYCDLFYGDNDGCSNVGCQYNRMSKKCLAYRWQWEYESSLIIVRLQKKRLGTVECHELDSHKAGCEYAYCKYEDGTDKCVRDEKETVEQKIARIGTNHTNARPSGDRCALLDTKPRSCKYAGCIYSLQDVKCLYNPVDDFELPPEEQPGSQSPNVGGVVRTNEECNGFNGKPVACRKMGCHYKLEKSICQANDGAAKKKPRRKKLTDDECAQLNGHERGCLYAHCTYDEPSMKCHATTKPLPKTAPKVPKLTRKECAELDGMEKACGYAGCHYLPDEKKCTATPPGFEDSVEDTLEDGPDSDEFCSDYNEKGGICKQNGCIYNRRTKKCLGYDPQTDNSTTKLVVISLRRKVLTLVECSQLDGYETGCLFAGCMYDEESSKCFMQSHVSPIPGKKKPKHKKLKDKECAVLDGKPRACGLAGCLFRFGTKKCQVHPADMPGNTGDTYYVNPDELYAISLESGKPHLPMDKATDDDFCNQYINKVGACTKVGCFFHRRTKKCVSYTPESEDFAHIIVTIIQPNLILNNPECATLDGHEKPCERAGCQYEEDKTKCIVDETPNGPTDEPKPEKLTTDECSEMFKKPRACGFAGCVFDFTTKKCAAHTKDFKPIGNKPDDEECKKYNGKGKTCRKAGCIYDKYNGKSCIADDEDPDEHVSTLSPDAECSEYNGKRRACRNVGCLFIKNNKKCISYNPDPEDDSPDADTTQIPKKPDGGDDEDDPYCNEYNGKQKDCRKQGCLFNRRTKKCIDYDPETDDSPAAEEPTDDEYCNDYDKKPGACKVVGCKYIKPTRKCVPNRAEPITISPIEPNRPNDEECKKFNGKITGCIKHGCVYNKNERLCFANTDPDDDESNVGTGDIPSDDECAEYNGKRKVCKKAGCAFIKKTKLCVSYTPDPEDNDTPDEEGENDSFCSENNGKPKSCKKAGCIFNRRTKKCFSYDPETDDEEPSDDEHCKDYDKNSGACKKVGCKYIKPTKSCVPIKDIGPPGGTTPGDNPDDAECAGYNGKRKACRKAGCAFIKKPKLCVSYTPDPEDDDSPDDTSGDDPTCSKYNGKPKSCKKNGCIFNRRTKKCLNIDPESDEEPSDDEYCKDYDRKPGACKKVGCKYMKPTKSCVPIKDIGSPGGTTPGDNPDDAECAGYNGKRKACRKAGCAFIKKPKLCVSYTPDPEDDDSPDDTSGDDPTCSKFNGKPKSCKKNGCIFNRRTKKCLNTDPESDEEEPSDDEYCSDYDRKPGACKKVGCKYMQPTKSCIPTKDIGSPGGTTPGDNPDDAECAGYNGKRKACRKAGCAFIKKPKLCVSYTPDPEDEDIPDDTSEDNPACRKNNGKPKSCKKNGCIFNRRTKKCLNNDPESDEEPSDDELCKDYDKNPGACKKVGCKYMKPTKSCVPIKEEGPPNDEECNKLNGNAAACKKRGCVYNKKATTCIGNTDPDDEDPTSGNLPVDNPSDTECAEYNGKRKTCRKAGCVFIKKTKECVSYTPDPEDHDTPEDASEDDPFCSEYNGKPKTCKKSGCIYNRRTKKCIDYDPETDEEEPTDDEYCKDYDKKEGACKKVGCKYIKPTRKCVAKKVERTTVGPPTATEPSLPNDDECKKFDGKIHACKRHKCAYNKKAKLCFSPTNPDGDDPKGGTEPGDNPNDDECAEYNGKRKDCKKAGCAFIRKNKQCISYTPDPEDDESPDNVPDDDPVCSKNNGKPKSCKKNGCIFNRRTKKCLNDEPDTDTVNEEPSDDEYCKDYDKKPGACKKVGCKYVKPTKKCVANIDEPTTIPPTELPPDDEECHKLDGNAVACKKRGCIYNKNAKTCIGNMNLEDDNPTGTPSSDNPNNAECAEYHGKRKACKKVGCVYVRDTKYCVSYTPDPEDEDSPDYEDPFCSEYNNKPISCKKSGCIYNRRTKKCIDYNPETDNDEPSEDDYCKDYDRKPGACKKAGCKYSEPTKNCVVNPAEPSVPPSTTEAGPPDDEECKKFDGEITACKKRGCVYNRKSKHCFANTDPDDDDPTSGTKPGENPNDEECAEYNGKRKSCKRAGCIFIKRDKKCISYTPDPEDDTTPEDSPPNNEDDDCKDYNGKPTSCKKSGCLYNRRTKKCLHPEDESPDKSDEHDDEYCSDYDKKPGACRKVGCIFIKRSKHCVAGNLVYDQATTTYIMINQKKGKLTATECPDLDGYQKGCEYAGCVYDDDTKKCKLDDTQDDPSQPKKRKHKKLNEKECNELDEKPRACGFAGCVYDVEGNKCGENPLVEDPDTPESKKPGGTPPDSDEYTYVIVKSKRKKYTPEECAELNGHKRGCNYARCRYDNATQKCLVGTGKKTQKGDPSTLILNSKECGQLNGKQRACDYAGCRYIVNKRKCEAGIYNDDSGNLRNNGDPSAPEGNNPDGGDDDVPVDDDGDGHPRDGDGGEPNDNDYPDGDGKGRQQGGPRRKVSVKKGPQGDPKFCAKFHNNADQCRKSHNKGCVYNADSQRCYARRVTYYKKKTTVVIVHRRKLTNEQCHELNEHPRGCRAAGCFYDVEIGHCNKGQSNGSPSKPVKMSGEDCRDLDGLPRGCNYAGCRFVAKTKKCVALEMEGGGGMKGGQKGSNAGGGDGPEVHDGGGGHDHDGHDHDGNDHDGHEGGGGHDHEGHDHDGHDHDGHDHDRHDRGGNGESGGGGGQVIGIANGGGGHGGDSGGDDYHDSGDYAYDDDSDFCSDFSHNRQQCIKNGCVYDKPSATCFSQSNDYGGSSGGNSGGHGRNRKSLSAEECDELSDKPRACVNAGCYFNEANRKCVRATARRQTHKKQYSHSYETEDYEDSDNGHGHSHGGSMQGRSFDGAPDVEADGEGFSPEPPEGKCKALTSKSVWSCKNAGCEFHSAKRSCVAGTIFCKSKTKTSREEKGVECLRANTWYSDGGILCFNKEESGNCSVIEVVVAVNMNGNTYVDPVRHVKYDAYAAVVREVNPPGVSRQHIDNLNATLPNRQLYHTYMMANPIDHFNQPCMRYQVPIKGDGFYELSLKLGDFIYDAPGMRSMNFWLNGHQFAVELDIVRHTSGKNNVMDLNVNFKVSREGRVLHLTGMIESRIINGHLPLEFCNGKGEPQFFVDSLWQISAWAVVKMKETVTLIEATNGTKGCTRHRCGQADEGCQYNVVIGKCLPAEKSCPNEIFEKIVTCRRKDAFYANAGKLCKNNQEQTGNCDNVHTIHALNLNGKEITDSRGIIYKSEGNFVMDSKEYRIPSRINSSCQTVDNVANEKEGLELYGTFIQADMSKANTAGCITYQFPLCQVGNYELSIKTLESRKVDVRCFDVLINNIPVIVDIDIFRMSGKRRCHAVEIIVSLKVEASGRVMYVMGFPNPVEINGKLDISLCYGDCEANERGFQASAISLVRFGDGTEVCDQSNIFNENPCECRKQHNEYNFVERKCLAKKSQDPCSFKGNGCKRANSFYADGGALCKNEVEKGDCASGTYLLAITFDARFKGIYEVKGVNYIPEHYIMHKITDKNQERRGKILNVECPKINGLPDDYDEEYGDKIYKTVLLTNPAKRGGSVVWVSYPIPICQDGKYELTIKTLEPFHLTANKRSFDISLNNVTVLNGVDIARLSQGKKCTAVDIIVEFEIRKDGTELIAQGHKYSVKISNQQVELKFANGMCTVPDHSVMVSAMTLVRFGSDTTKCADDWYSLVS